MGQGVKAKCKNCGLEAVADQFKLHYQLRMMVCPACFSGKPQKKDGILKNEVKVEEKKRPPGWDAEDEYLEKLSRMKQAENQAQFSKIPGTDQVRCKCAQCKYDFKYDPYKRMPLKCPYCDVDVPRLKTFNLL